MAEDASSEPLLVNGPMGPFLHVAQRNNDRVHQAVDGYQATTDYALWWIGSGRAELDRDGRRARLQLPAMLLQHPGDRSRLYCTGGSEWIRVAFDLVYQPLRRGGPGNTRIHADDSVQPVPERVFGCQVPGMIAAGHLATGKPMLDDCLAWWWRSEVDLQRANHRLGLWLMDWVRSYTGGGTAPTRGDWFAQCCALVEERLELGVSVSDLAETVGMSPVTFRRRFRERAGCSPRTYLARARLQRAKDLLLGDGTDILDVAHRSGFASRSTFSLQFRRAVGCSPGEWRRRHRRPDLPDAVNT